MIHYSSIHRSLQIWLLSWVNWQSLYIVQLFFSCHIAIQHFVKIHLWGNELYKHNFFAQILSHYDMYLCMYFMFIPLQINMFKPNPSIWRLDFCQIIKFCSCFWMDHKSKQVYSLIDRFRSINDVDFALYLYKGAICSAKQTKYTLIRVLLVKRGHILAFYRPNFRLQT